MKMTKAVFVLGVGLLLLAVGFTLADPALQAEDLDDRNVGLGGGDDGDNYTRINNTIFVNNESADPIMAGTFAQGELANIFVTNLTNETDYTLVDPDGNEIGNLTAVDGEVRWYKVDIEAFGTWELYRTEDLDLLGLLNAEPVVTFDVDDTLSADEVGTTSLFIPSEDLPEVVASAQPCSYEVENGTAKRAGKYENDTAYVSSGGEFVDIRLNWTVRETEDNKSVSEFLVSAEDSNVEGINDPRLASGRPEVGPGQGSTSVVLWMEPGDTAEVECLAFGPDRSPKGMVWTLLFGHGDKERVTAKESG